VRTSKIVAVGLLAFLSLGLHAAAQSLPASLFERYIDALRLQTGIPGISAVIVEDGRIVWDHGFGYRDLEPLTPARSDTPSPILDISQTLSSTVLLHQCLDLGGRLDVSDKVRRWYPDYPDDTTTVGQLLSHAASGSFRYPQRAPLRVKAAVDCRCVYRAHPPRRCDTDHRVIGPIQE